MKKTIGLIIVSLIFILGIAAILFKTDSSPKNTQQSVSKLSDLIDKPLPAIQLYDKDGKKYSMDSLRGKNVVLFFSEGIMCYPACWDQIASFGTDQRFNSPDTVAISVVTDSPQEWEPAKNKMPDLAKATMLFDQNLTVSKQLALLSLPSSMHVGGIPGHTYIVLDKQGVVRYVFDDPRMANNNDVIVSEIDKLNKSR